VVGIRDTGLSELDEFFSCVSIETAQNMALIDRETNDVVDLVHIKLKDPFKADEVAARLGKKIQTELGIPAFTRSWGEMNPGLFQALALEKLAMFVILLLIVAVAGLNIMGTLILITMEKTREIGILRAMGTPRRSITKIFLAEGLFIGIIGTTLGIIFGLGICYILKYHCPVDIPEEIYNLRGIPVKIKVLTVLTISASSIAICLISSVIPALLAARLKVVEALRYE
jgi:lipoprotein-releasing system permease protein